MEVSVILIYNHHLLQQSCGSVVLADGRLADLIRRVATFGMILMKLDLRQVCFICFCDIDLLAPPIFFDISLYCGRNLVDMLKH